MATLDELVDNGVLLRQRIKLSRGEFEDRKFYVSPGFRTWLNGPVMQAKQFYGSDVKPRIQAHDLLKSFIIGRPFRSSRMFKRMSPGTDDIYELRSPDLRFFGWFPMIDVFVAFTGDTFENLKGDQRLYDIYRMQTKVFRNDIDLNEPKYLVGASENNVVSS